MADRYPIAHAQAIISAAGAIVAQDGGLVSASRSGAGVYLLTLRAPASQLSLAPIVSPNGNTGPRSYTVITVNSAAATPQVSVLLYDDAGAPADFDFNFSLLRFT